MPRSVALADHLTPEELEGRYRAARDPVERTRLQALWLVAGGRSVAAVAEVVGYSPTWLRTLIRRYNARGADALADGRRANRGGTPLLPPARQAELRAALAGPAPDGGLWTGPKVAAWMADRLGRPVHPQRGWEQLRRLGLSLQRPRPRETRADPAAHDAFKKGGSPANWTASGGPIPPPR